MKTRWLIATVLIISLGCMNAPAHENGSNANESAAQEVAVSTTQDTKPFNPEPREVEANTYAALIPACTFKLGGYPAVEGASASEERTVSAFYLARHEVTVAEYRAFIEDGGYCNPQYWSEEGWQWRYAAQNTSPMDWESQEVAALPVRCVSYYEAEAYAAWIGGRLPTELEWEAALKGAENREFPWGGEWSTSRANFNYDGQPRLKPVGEDSATPEGVCDLLGSVREWTTNPIIDYPAYATPVDPGQQYGVVRGGSYLMSSPPGTDVLQSVRIIARCDTVREDYGIRVAFNACDYEDRKLDSRQ